MFYRHTAFLKQRESNVEPWYLKVLWLIPVFKIHAASAFETMKRYLSIILFTRSCSIRLILITALITCSAPKPVSASPHKCMEALLCFSPGSQLTSQMSAGMSVKLGFTGQGKYIAEVYTPSQHVFTREIDSRTADGFFVEISMPETSSLAIRLYSIFDTDPVNPSDYLLSDKPLFNSDITTINKMPFSKHEKVAVPYKKAPLDASFDAEKSQEAYPVTLFEYFPVSQNENGLKPEFFAPHQYKFKSALIYTDEALCKQLRSSISKLSHIGRFTLYHILGGHFCYTPALVSAGQIHSNILLTQCNHLLTIRGHDIQALQDMLCEIAWLKKEVLRKDQSLHDYTRSASGKSGAYALPTEVSALYDTLTDDSLRSALTPEQRCTLCHEHNKDATFLKAACLLPRTDDKWKKYRNSARTLSIPTGVISKYIQALTEYHIPVKSELNPEPTLSISLSHTAQDRPLTTNGARSGSIEATKIRGGSEHLNFTSTNRPPPFITSAQDTLLRNEHTDAGFCVNSYLEKIALFQPHSHLTFSSQYHQVLETLEKGYDDLSQLHHKITPPFLPQEPPTGLICDPALGFPSGLMKDYTPLKLLGQGSEAQCFLVHTNLEVAGTQTGEFYALRFEQNFHKPDDDHIRPLGLLQMDAFRHPRAISIYSQQLITPKQQASRRKRKKTPEASPAQKWYLQLQEYCPGGDLQAWIDEKGALEKYPLWATTVSLLDVTATWHSRCLVHRDLKPANIFIGQDGHIRVADYGMAKCTHSNADIMTESIVGTPVYIGRLLSKALDGGATQYNTYLMDHIALGATLYALATGEQFYNTPDINNLALCIQAQAEYFEWLSQRYKQEGLDPLLSAVTNMEKELSQRYQQLGLTHDPSLCNLIAQLLCSNMKDNMGPNSLLEYFEHAYIHNNPVSSQSSQHSAHQRAKRKKTKTPPIYRPEILLSDKLELLRPTLTTPLVISRSRALEKMKDAVTTTGLDAISQKAQIEEFMQQVQMMGMVMQASYFYQPLPAQHNGWPHAFLLGRLIQIIQQASTSDEPETVFKKAVTDTRVLAEKSGKSTDAVVKLIQTLSAELNKRHILEVLYNDVLKDCTLYKASSRFTEAANELSACSYYLMPQTTSELFDPIARIKALDDNCIIIEEEKLRDSLPEDAGENIILYRHPGGWEIFIRK